MSRKHGIPAMAGLLLCVLFLASVCRAQQQQRLSKDDQFLIAGMLRQAHDEVKKNYYDPKLQGLDWDARYRQYSAQVGTAPNLGEGFRLVAAFLGGLKDSHTFFEPPIRAHGSMPDIISSWWEMIALSPGFVPAQTLNPSCI